MTSSKDGNQKARIPYEPPKVFDLGEGVAYAAKHHKRHCRPGGSPVGKCQPGAAATGGKCQPGNVASHKCQPGMAPGGPGGKCHPGGIAVGGKCQPGGSAAGKCKPGGTPG